MSWFRRPPRYTAINRVEKKSDIPDGLWMRCEKCNEMFFKKEWEENLKICLKCGHYSIMEARERLDTMVDPGSFEEEDVTVASLDPLQFKGYAESLARNRKKTGEKDAIIGGSAKVCGKPVQIAVFDFRFMAGSMGSAVGEKVTRTLERALEQKKPAIIVSAGGGGARMHEGMLSLMQMAKTSAAVAQLRENGLPFISVLTHPTMGGVAASFASLGDIILAEPGALIGFAGPRVIEQTIGQRLPDGFQTAEFLLDHGFIDSIVDRHELPKVVSRLVRQYYN